MISMGKIGKINYLILHTLKKKKIHLFQSPTKFHKKEFQR